MELFLPYIYTLSSVLYFPQTLLYLDYVQFRQQVAVCKGELVPIQEAAVGALLLLHAVCVDLIGQRAVQVVVQLLQGLGQTLLQS